jgi:hypothetical protein
VPIQGEPIGHHAPVPDDDLVLVDPWMDLRGGGTDEAAERDRIVEELRAEVASGHSLHRLELTAVGRLTPRDDFLFRLADGRWAIVHLTWTRPETPPWPATRLFDSVEALEEALLADSA